MERVLLVLNSYSYCIWRTKEVLMLLCVNGPGWIAVICRMWRHSRKEGKGKVFQSVMTVRLCRKFLPLQSSTLVPGGCATSIWHFQQESSLYPVSALSRAAEGWAANLPYTNSLIFPPSHREYIHQDAFRGVGRISEREPCVPEKFSIPHPLFQNHAHFMINCCVHVIKT